MCSVVPALHFLVGGPQWLLFIPTMHEVQMHLEKILFSKKIQFLHFYLLHRKQPTCISRSSSIMYLHRKSSGQWKSTWSFALQNRGMLYENLYQEHIPSLNSYVQNIVHTIYYCMCILNLTVKRSRLIGVLNGFENLR